MADYTVDQYRAAAKRAYEAGNIESAKRLIAAGRDLQAQQGLRGERAGSAFDAFMHKAQQGVTLGFGDELNAGLRAAGDWFGGKPFGEAYDERLAAERGMLEQIGEENPVASVVGEMGGAALPAVLTGGAGLVGTGTGMLGRMAGGAAIGAGEGAIYGFGTGEGGADQRLESAATGAAVGAGAGAAAPPLLGAIRAAGTPVARAVGGALGIGDDRRAAQSIAQLLERSGKSAQDVTDDIARAAKEGQGVYRTVDALGHAGQRKLAGIARAPGDGRQEIVEFLERRQAGQGERLSSSISDAFGFGGQTGAGPVLSGAQRSAQGADEALRAARGAAANTEYAAARQGAQAVDTFGVVKSIDDTLGNLRGSGIKMTDADAALERARSMLATGDARLSDFDTVLRVKQDLSDEIQSLRRAGRNQAAARLAGVVKDLDASLEGASAGYRLANDEFARRSRVIDALQGGKQASMPSSRPQDVEAVFGGMSPEEQAAARIGYGDTLRGQIDNAAEGTNKARPLTSAKRQSDIGTMATDPDRIKRQIGREQTMFETRRQATGGSQTADNQQDIAEALGENTNAIVNALSGRFGAAAQQVGGAVMRAAKGENDATRKIIAQALLSDDPQRILANAVRRRQLSHETRNAVERAITGAGVTLQ